VFQVILNTFGKKQQLSGMHIQVVVKWTPTLTPERWGLPKQHPVDRSEIRSVTLPKHNRCSLFPLQPSA